MRSRRLSYCDTMARHVLIAIGVALLTVGAAELMAGFYKLLLALVAAWS
jgi:hypothetical protein